MTTPLIDTTGLEALPALAASLAIGLLIGVERERTPSAKAGLRTFALVSLFGSLAAMLGEQATAPWIVAVGLVLVGTMIVAAYALDPQPSSDPGTTTVIALLIAYSLGVMCFLGDLRLAAMIAIATTALLYFKPELRGILERFSRHDLLSVLQFGLVSFIVLPLLPNESFGPYGALNPYRIWLMVVLISGISLAGYIALRVVGGERGATLVGLFGGLVSSTATTLAYSRHGRNGAVAPLAARVILIANLVVIMRLLVVTAVVAPGFLGRLAPSLVTALAAGVVATVIAARRMRSSATLPVPEAGNPAELRAAIAFGGFFAAILLLAAWLNDIAGNRGLYLVAAASGLTDVDAITLSTLQLYLEDAVAGSTAVIAIVVALVSNQVVKLGMVLSAGGIALFQRCALPMAITGAIALVVAFALR